MPAQTTSIDKSPLQLCCLIKGQGSVFTVPVATDKNTFDVKKLVYEEGKKTLGNVDVTSLVFLKNILESSSNILSLHC